MTILLSTIKLIRLFLLANNCDAKLACQSWIY